MSNGLHWIRFANGKEKQVPQHLALDASTQKSQNFVPIDGPKGNTLTAQAAPVVTEKKSVAEDELKNAEEATANAEIKPAPEAGTITTDTESVEAKMIRLHTAGKSYAEIAKEFGVHWKKVEKVVVDSKKPA